ISQIGQNYRDVDGICCVSDFIISPILECKIKYQLLHFNYIAAKFATRSLFDDSHGIGFPRAGRHAPAFLSLPALVLGANKRYASVKRR
ncbi:MAG: hypothetical protein PVH94_07865, partial [Desulfobacterales bacterium]